MKKLLTFIVLLLSASAVFAEPLMLFNGPTTTISVTTSASTALALPANVYSIRAVNIGTVVAYCATGTSSSLAATVPTAGVWSTTSTAAYGPEDATFNLTNGQQYISCITSSGSTTVVVQVGSGQ